MTPHTPTRDELPDDLAADVLTIAKYTGQDIEGFNRFIMAAKMCGYELVRNGKPLRSDCLPSPTSELVAALERFKDKMAKAKALDNPRVFVEEYIAEAIEAADDYLAALAAHGGKK